MLTETLIKFSNDGGDDSTFPQLSSPGANVLGLGNGDLRLDAGRKLVFPGDAPLSVTGDLIISTGSPTPKERLSHLIALRLTPAEHRKLEQLAQKSSLSVSDYVRQALGFKGK